MAQRQQSTQYTATVRQRWLSESREPLTWEGHAADIGDFSPVCGYFRKTIISGNKLLEDFLESIFSALIRSSSKIQVNVTNTCLKRFFICTPALHLSAPFCQSMKKQTCLQRHHFSESLNSFHTSSSNKIPARFMKVMLRLQHFIKIQGYM